MPELGELGRGCAGPLSPVNPAEPDPATVLTIAVGRDAPDAVVVHVGDVQAAGVVDCEPRGTDSRVAALAGPPSPLDEGARTGAGDQGNLAIQTDLPHALVARVAEKHVASGVDSNAARIVALGLRGRAAFSGITGDAGARDGW